MQTKPYAQIERIYVTIFSCLIDPETGELRIDTAKHDVAMRKFTKALRAANWTWSQWFVAEQRRIRELGATTIAQSR